ncbi:hypothetical protein GALMADRAFT_154280 [Galerina marginata CBS 339.88]|uniref:Uncharacterized protein n=1 Tax=Galerina marginata (strain CBS 339.88) TaxID=685588 RepID=A0A067THI5_GALM3|nr:hypothetical protein GALMADRAFT_154280 [Galerina marginata CBS 339.88]
MPAFAFLSQNEVSFSITMSSSSAPAPLLPAAEIAPRPHAPRPPRPPPIGQAIARPVFSRSRLENRLDVSMIAINDTREASWYGPWAIALDILFTSKALPQNVYYVTTPQLPVVRGYDPVAEEENEDTDNIDDAADEEAGGSPYPAFHGPESPGPMRTFSSSESYPEEGDAHMITDTRPSTPDAQIFVPAQPPSTRRTYSFSSDTQPNKKKGKTRSTRVPDFSTYLHFQEFVTKLRSYLVLIVEIKPKRGKVISPGIYSTIPQVTEQARHAFDSDPSLKILGCMICVSSSWTYFDIERDTLPPSPKPDRRTRSMGGNIPNPPANVEDDEQEQGFLIPAPFLVPIFGQSSIYLSLTDIDRTKLAFEMILKHLANRVGISTH